MNKRHALKWLISTISLILIYFIVLSHWVGLFMCMHGRINFPFIHRHTCDINGNEIKWLGRGIAIKSERWNLNKYFLKLPFFKCNSTFFFPSKPLKCLLKPQQKPQNKQYEIPNWLSYRLSHITEERILWNLIQTHSEQHTAHTQSRIILNIKKGKRSKSWLHVK